MLLLPCKDHGNLPWILLSKNDETCTYWEDLILSAQIHMPALVVARSIVFPRLIGVNSGLVSVLLGKKFHGYSFLK